MKLFVDTGNLKDIEALAAIGVLDGVTTNPSLMAKESGDYRQILKQICQVVKGPVSAEVVATDTAGMVREGRDLAAIDEHIVVKVPFTKDGVKACKALSSEGMRVNVTLIFSPTQALLAAKVGATYVSPFVGRLDDIATSGMHLVQEIVEKMNRVYFFHPRKIKPGSISQAFTPAACDFSQSFRNFSSPTSVSGCLNDCSMMAAGTVQTSAPIRAASTM